MPKKKKTDAHFRSDRPAVSGLLDVYETELAGVEFPDVDGANLRKQVSAVEDLHRKAAELRNELEATEAALAAEGKAAEALFGKALAYARVYAATTPDLLNRMSRWSFGMEQPRPKKPRARRKTIAAAAKAAPEPKDITPEVLQDHGAMATAFSGEAATETAIAA